MWGAILSAAFFAVAPLCVYGSKMADEIGEPMKFLKSSYSAQQIQVCPVSFGGLHYISDTFTSTDAPSACASFGWRLAMLEEGPLNDFAGNLLFVCQGVQGGYAWIGGYNGMAADPCMATVYNSTWIGAYANLGINFCRNELAGIICQEPPVFTDIFTEDPTTVTIPFGTSTVTTTTTIYPPPSQQQHHHHHHHHQQGPRVAKSGDCPSSCRPGPEDPQIPLCDADCHPRRSSSCVTPCGFGYIKVLQSEILPQDAERECAKHGWTLLDMTSAQENLIQLLFEGCLPDPTAGAWIRSFNGIAAECAFAQMDPLSGRVTAQFPVAGDFCSGGFYVLCQTACAMPVGHGVDEGSISITKTSTTPVTVLTTPTTTVTTTTTVIVFPK